jgi:positive regulator of sigma E activity
MRVLDTEFKIKFDGEQHQIDASLLINNLIHTTAIIQEINRNLDSGKKIDIKIKALEKGSFLIHIDLIETALDSLKNLLTKENLQIASSIIASLVGLIEVKKFLKGKRAKSEKQEGDRVRIENESGQVIYVDSFVQNIYGNNTIVRDALSQSFETLDNDTSISGYEITDKYENPLIRVERNDFSKLSIKEDQILEGEKISTIAATLNIIRISFDPNLKSDFYYKGNKISVKINDPEFYKQIDTGESFAKGDILEVELEVKQVFDSAVNTYVNKGYKVNRIVRHVGRNEQSKLDI